MLLEPTEETAEGPVLEEPMRRLIVAWQDPSTRAYHRIGYLEVFEGPMFRFRYDADALDQLPSFEPFPNFPDEPFVYESPELFPFFNNRVLSPKRPEYASLLRAMALGEDATPLELLERSGGERATDTIQVFPVPTANEVGQVHLVFPAHGVRYVSGASERISRLTQGDPLEFRDDPENAYNPHALLVVSGEPLGWVPDFLLATVRDLTENYGDYRVVVEAANGPDVPFHFRLLCRLEVDNAAEWDPDDF